MNKKLVIVLGPHRSGTSLLTAAVESLGAYLGIEDQNVSDENPKGFFENQKIINFNDRLLQFLGGHWDNPLFDGCQAINLKPATELTPWIQEAVDIFISNFDAQSFIAIKDPRMCQLLPFWGEVFSRCKFKEDNIYYVHIARHPMEVARSQYKRRLANPEYYIIGDNLLETVSLWFSLSYQSLRNINSDNNIFFCYSDLVNRPKGQVVRLAKFLNIEYSQKELDNFCNIFVDKNLRRNIAESSETYKLKKEFPEAMELFKQQKYLASKNSFSRIDTKEALSIWQRAESQQHLIEPIIPFISRLAAQRLILNSNIRQITDERERLKQDLSLTTAEQKTLIVKKEKINKAVETEVKRVKQDKDELGIALEASLAEKAQIKKTLEAEVKRVKQDKDELGIALEASLAEKEQIKNSLEAEVKRVKLDKDELGIELEASRAEKEQIKKSLEAEVKKVEQKRDQLRSELKSSRKDNEKIIKSHEIEIEKAKRIREELSAELIAESKLRQDSETLRENMTQEIHHLMSDREQTETDLVLAQEVVVAMKNTISWRVTAPLRWIRTLQNRLSAIFSRAWSELRIKARNHNQQLKTYAPWLSYAISVVLRPFFKIMDHFFGKRRDYLSLNEKVFVSRDQNDRFHSEYQQPDFSYAKQPLVSIIVPNYNHAAFLRQRLDSIYGQTYAHYEVILLDDCSKDNSREILDEYCCRYPKNTRLIFNETNSGGVFNQWEKGLSAANGDLIWVAESDDWCTNNFLEELVGYFNDEAVMLAYCRTAFMDSNGKNQIWSIEEYLSDIDAQMWNASFVRTAHHIVNNAWAIKNILPNVSSALFRNPGRVELLNDQSWKNMRICGDWVFYLHIIRGGLVAYSVDAINYYRIHSSNTSVATYSDDSYYIEHEKVAKCIIQLYSVSEHVFEQQRENIKQHWIQNRPSFSENELDRCYSIDRIMKVRPERKPNLMMASYAFAAGGGETFPIQLANIFKGYGYGVTFLNCNQEKVEKDVRSMLRKDIPVINNFRLLYKITMDFGIEIIHSHHAWVDNTIIDLLPEDSNCQTVISLHGMYETIDNKDLKRILPRLLARSGKLIYTAEKNLDPFKNKGLFDKNKFIKIGNALDTCPITPIDLRELGISKDAFVLCLVSRAIPEKGWKEAVESIKLAREFSGRDIHLILIGEGQEYDYYLKKGHPDYVHLLGFRKNIRDYYAASDMGYLPSRFSGESFPLTVIDCLHAGKPVLASDIGEIPNMLEAEGKLAGCLFSLEKWKIPVQQVGKLISHCATDKKYYSEIKKLVPVAVKRFNPDIMRDKYDKLYTNLAHIKMGEEQMVVDKIREAQSV